MADKELLNLKSVMEKLDLSKRQVYLIIEKGWLPPGKSLLGEAMWTSEAVEKFKWEWLHDKLPPAKKVEKKRRRPPKADNARGGSAERAQEE